MTWTPNVPRATDRIADTQAPIETNFNIANQDFGVDHYGFDGSTDNIPDSGSNGYHNKVTMPTFGSVPTAPASAGLMFSNEPTDSRTFPFWSRDAGAQAYPMLPIKAFGGCTISANECTVTQSYNVASGTQTGIVWTSVGHYTVNITSELASTNYLVIGTVARNASNLWSFSYYGQTASLFKITITTSGLSGDPDGFSFIVIEV